MQRSFIASYEAQFKCQRVTMYGTLAGRLVPDASKARDQVSDAHMARDLHCFCGNGMQPARSFNCGLCKGYGQSTRGRNSRRTLSIASCAVSTPRINQGAGELFRTYALAKRDGVEFRLTFIDDGFREPHTTEFDHPYMTRLFEYIRIRVRSGYPWLTAPPGF
jgi:hypothetical protein